MHPKHVTVMWCQQLASVSSSSLSTAHAHACDTLPSPPENPLPKFLALSTSYSWPLSLWGWEVHHGLFAKYLLHRDNPTRSNQWLLKSQQYTAFSPQWFPTCSWTGGHWGIGKAYTYIHTYIRTYVRTYIHTYIHVQMAHGTVRVQTLCTYYRYMSRRRHWMYMKCHSMYNSVCHSILTEAQVKGIVLRSLTNCAKFSRHNFFLHRQNTLCEIISRFTRCAHMHVC